MKIKMLQTTYGAPHGYDTQPFKAGEVYDTTEELAKAWIADRTAEPFQEEAEPEEGDEEEAETPMNEEAPKKRGRNGRPENPLTARVAELERENQRLRKKLHQAETIIEVQKKLSGLLGLTLNENQGDEAT